MAERLLCKITRCRFAKFLSVRCLSMVPLDRHCQSYSEALSDSARDDNRPQESPLTIRALTMPRFRERITNEAQMFRENARKQHLQPCLLPKFYRSNMNFSSVDGFSGFGKKF